MATQQSTTINDVATEEEAEVLIRSNEVKENKPITFFRAWLLPGVAMVKTIKR